MISSFSILKKRNGGESKSGEVSSFEQPPAAESAEASIEAVDASDIARALGTYHEGLRSRSEAVLNSLGTFRQMADEVDALFGAFGDIARELHANRKELSEVKTDRDVLARQNEELKEKLSTGESMILKLEGQMDELWTERDLLERMRNEIADAHKKDQIALQESDARIKLLDRELQNANTLIGNLNEKVENFTAQVADNDKQLNELREERKLLQSSLEFEKGERERVSRLHEEVVASAQSQRRALTTASEELDVLRSRTLGLESLKSELTSERDELRAAVKTAETLREADTKNFEIKLEALTSRARLAEHLLEKAREDQRNTFHDKSAHMDAQRQVRRLEGDVERLTKELAETARKAKELEGKEHHLQTRVDEANLQIRGLHRAAESSAEKIKMQQEVVEALHRRHSEYVDDAEMRIKTLTEQLENERADRTYLEGALSSVRRERNKLQTQRIQLSGSKKNAGVEYDLRQLAGDDDLDVEATDNEQQHPTRDLPGH